MKSYEEAKAIVASGAYTYKGRSDRFDKLTPAQQRRRHLALKEDIEGWINAVATSRDYARVEVFLKLSNSIKSKIEALDSHDPSGLEMLRACLAEMNKRMSDDGYPTRWPNTPKDRKALWSRIRVDVKEKAHQNRVREWIQLYGLDPQGDYSTQAKLNRARGHVLARQGALERKALLKTQQLENERREAETRKRLGLDQAANADLAHLLSDAAQAVLTGQPRGFVYFKCWVLPDGSRWYKLGVTNDLSRRDSEQNVLPVAAVTIASAGLPSMEDAYAVESAMHAVLGQKRITGANNRELFHLKPEDVSAVQSVVESLGEMHQQITLSSAKQ